MLKWHLYTHNHTMCTSLTTLLTHLSPYPATTRRIATYAWHPRTPSQIIDHWYKHHPKYAEYVSSLPCSYSVHRGTSPFPRLADTVNYSPRTTRYYHVSTTHNTTTRHHTYSYARYEWTPCTALHYTTLHSYKLLPSIHSLSMYTA